MKARILPFMEQTDRLERVQPIVTPTTPRRTPPPTSTTINDLPLPVGREQGRAGGSRRYNGLDFGDNNYYNNLGTLLSLNGGIFDGPAYIMGSADVRVDRSPWRGSPTGRRTPRSSASA